MAGRSGLLALLALVATITTAAADDVAGLMSFANSATNWDAVKTRPGFMGYDGTDPCAPPGWTGVICKDNIVTELNLIVLGIEGPLPANLTELKSLERLDLSNNAFTGPLPASWAGGFPKLKAMYIRFNKLTGPLPASWGAPTAFPVLEEFDFAQNSIDGSLPAEWGQKGSFPSLLTLGIEHNSLTGPIPASWGTGGGFQKLKNLNLIFNQLAGPLPSPLKLPALTILQLEHNAITGPLPPNWPNEMPMLTTLNVAFNQLSGPIPASYGPWTTLTSATLFPNPGLCGPIPYGLVQDIAPSAKDPLMKGGDGLPIANNLQCSGAPAPVGSLSGMAPVTAPFGSGAPGQVSVQSLFT